MVKKGCEKTPSNREKKMECNMKAANVGNQQNVFESQQYFPQMTSGAHGYKHQNMHMGHSKYPSNEQFYQRSGSVLSSQSIPGTLQNMQHVQSHQYKSPNYYANASQTVFQPVSYPAGVLKEASSNQKYNRNTNKMLLEYMHQKNCYMPAYYENGTSALPQSVNKQFNFQPTAAYQKVPGHVSFANAGEVSGNKSGQNSKMQVTPYSFHLGSQASYDVQSEWPPNLSPELTQTSNYNSVHHLGGESFPKQMQSPVPEQVQQQRHVQLPQEVLQLLQPNQLYEKGDTSVQNHPSLYSDAQNIYDWDHQPQKISTENGSNNEVVSSCAPLTANCDANLSPKGTSSNVSSQASADLQRVLGYGHEYTPTSAPANMHNLLMGTMPVQGNYSVYGSNGFPNSIINSLNQTENSKVSNEAMVHKKVLGAKDNFINARWHCNDKYMFRSVHSDGSLENADVHGSDTSPNICGNGLNGDSWSVVPHAATNSQTPEALSSYKTVYQQNLQTQSYSSQEENYVGQTSVGNTEGLHRLGLQTVKSSPTLTAVSSHRSQDQNEPALSNPFTNYLRNKYLTLEEVNKSHESVKKTKSSDFMEGVLSEQSQDQCALAHGLSASASKIRNNCQSGHPNLSTVPDRNGNPMEKELLKYSAREQTYKPMQNDTSDRGINLPSPNSKSTAPGSVSNTVASQTGSLPIVIAVKQEPIDLMQDKFHLDLCNKMASRTDKVDEQQPTRDVDPKLTLPPQGLCQQNDAVLHKSKKAVCLNEKTNAVSSIDVGNQCCDRAVTGRRPDLFGINIKKSTEPQIAVVNPLTPSKSESPSKDQENVPPRNGMYHASQEALRGPLSRKRKLAVVSTSGNIDHMSTVNMLLDILGSDAAVNCPGSQKVIPMTCDLNSKISDPQSKAKESAPAVDSTQSLLQLKSNEFAQPHTSPLCQEKPELQLVDGAVLLVNGACKEQLQISSVCTLVEGSTFYDSQIAKIFDAYSLEQSKDPDIELGELQKNKLMDIENKTCEPGVLDSPTEQRPRLDPNCKWKNQNNPVRRSNCSNQMILVSNSEPEQTVLEAVNKNKEAFVELAIANENGLSSSPFTSQIECCRNEGELEEQMTNMADSMQEEMPEGDEASSEPYLNSQLSELLRIFPFGIDTMETGATSEESDVLKEDKDGSNFSQLHEHEPDKENTVSSTVVGQAERTPPTIQAEVEKGLQSTNDCNIQSPDNDPKNGDTVDKEKGKPKSKDFQLVSGLESDRTVYSMQSEKLCSLQKQSIALLNSQHPGFLFRANGQPPCDTNRKCRENAKELTAMANGTGSNSNQVSSNAFVGMGTMQPVSYNFLLPVYSGEKKGFYVNNMATNSKTSSFKLDATYQNTVNQQIDEHSYFHLNSSSQINGNSEKIEDPATFHLTHQGKILQNCLPNNGVGWHKIEWVNSGKKLNCLPVEQNVYRSSDTRKSGTCEKGEQTRLMLQQVTTPTAGGAHSAFGCQDSIFKEHPPNTHAYHKVDRKSPSPKKHKEQSCLVGLSKEKKKKTRLIVKTDFLKPKANKAKLCQKPADVHGVKLIDDQPRVSENGCLKSMLSSDKCVAHSAKHGDNVKVSLSVNASCSVTDGGLIGEKRGVKEQACEESKDPRTVIYDAVVADDQLHNLAVQEFFQRRKAEQNTGGKKTQPAWEKHKAKQPVQYRKPSIILEKLEEGVKRKNEAGLEGNLSKHPKKAPQKPMESIGENFLTRIAFTGYENGVIQLVNFDFLNSLKNTLSLKAPKPVVAKPQTPEEEPKVLEFKLCPAELLGGHTADDESSGAGSPVSPDDSLSEESKNKGDASSSNIPLKKRKVDMALLQGNISVPKPVLNQDLFSTEKTSHPQTPNSKVLFNAFKKLYLETQSRNVA